MLRFCNMLQWSTNATEHAHVQEVKVSTWTSNNQNYYNHIAQYLDCFNKYIWFDLATYFK